MPADLMKPYRTMVSTLCEDKKWLTMFDPEPEHKGVEVIKLSGGKGGGKGKTADAQRLFPKDGLKFTVIFTFKSTAPPPKAAPSPKTGAATAAAPR